MTLPKEIIKQNPHYPRGQKVMFDLCVTRWLQNSDSCSMFLVTLPFIVDTLEVIGCKLHMEKYQKWKGWDIESRRRAAKAYHITQKMKQSVLKSSF